MLTECCSLVGGYLVHKLAVDVITCLADGITRWITEYLEGMLVSRAADPDHRLMN